MSFKLKSSNTLKNLRDMTLLLLAKHSLQLHSDRNNNNNIIYLKRIDRVVDIFSSVCTAKQLRFESLPPPLWTLHLRLALHASLAPFHFAFTKFATQRICLHTNGGEMKNKLFLFFLK